MDTGGARDVAEERVCALLGIPAAVVGFGAGLQQTKVGATMQQMSKQAWENGVLPFCRLAADELKRSLLPQLDRKSIRLTPVTNAHLVCRLLLEQKKQQIQYTDIAHTPTRVITVQI